ncbi:MAG: ankyrin repeat domain-containing protein [Synergistaceae bacterium]|nr:ankyrin repeat domain-containing protein [Synergistaceae bacterium]
MIITAYDSDFYELCAYGTAQEVREAIKAGANVNAGENFTPLMNAIKCRNIRVIKTLIDAGVDVNAKDIIGCSALNMVLQHDDIKIMNILIKAGADVNNKDKEGYTVLIRAVHYNNIDAVNILLGAGADVNVKNNIGETALTSAMQYGTNLQIIRTLLKAGADVNVQNEYGKTALMKIISKIDEDDDHLDVIKTLNDCSYVGRI